MITKDYDTMAQVEMFDHYLAASADVEDRTLHGRGYSYAECEWEAFQSGWNAAKLYFTVEGQAL
jgi:hypothetical protein